MLGHGEVLYKQRVPNAFELGDGLFELFDLLVQLPRGSSRGPFCPQFQKLRVTGCQPTHTIETDSL